MIARLRLGFVQRLLCIALPLAIGFLFLFPGISEAHAILLQSDPVRDALLQIPPQQVRMWFSEDLNPTFSTAVVINANNQRVDNRDAHVATGNAREMDVSLAANLPSNVYIVVWRTDSNDDGHILRGSFIFTVARSGETIPTLNANANPGQKLLGGDTSSGLYTGQLDAISYFNLFMITLAELGAIFWVGAQFWYNFVLQPSVEEHQEERETNQRVQRRFERFYALPTLLGLLLVNLGVLLGQAIPIAGGSLKDALAPSLLTQIVTSERFGTYWLMREIVIILAIALAVYTLVVKVRSPRTNTTLSWANLLLGLALFIAITMSGHAAAVTSNIALAVMVDWLHLLAAAFWVGGMLYIACVYIPTLRLSPLLERARSLTTLLPYYSPWALAGVILMAVTGPFSATFHLTSWDQFLSTAYGRVLLVKIFLVCALLVTSAIHVLVLRPRLAKELKKYAYVAARLQESKANPALIALPSDQVQKEPESTTTTVTQQVKLRKERLTKRTRRLSSVLSWEPWLGVGVLVCVGLMNVFAGTLSPTSLASQQSTTAQPKPFHTTVKTSDSKFTVTLDVNPNTFGSNLFTVSVVDNSSGKPTTNIGISLYTTMLDMQMGTDTVNLQPDNKGAFSARSDLSMGGHWQIRVQVRTPDNKLHEATVTLYTPF